MTTDPNAPAYPHTKIVKYDGYPAEEEEFTGLTKRELFAMHAMQGMIAGDYDTPEIQRPKGETTFSVVAKLSVEFADALISKLSETK